MATEEQVKLMVMVRVSSLWKPLNEVQDNPEAFASYYREYIKALKPFASHVLERCVDVVASEWVSLKWPPPAKFVQAAIQIERDARPTVKALTYQAPPPQSKEQRAHVQGLMKRMNALFKRRDYGKMTPEQEYDAVYLDEPETGHRWKTLARWEGELI